MTEPMPDQTAVETLQGVLRELKATRDEVAKLRKSGRRTFRFVLFDVLITVGVFVAGGIGINAAQSASHADSAQLALCQSSNKARAQQVDLWEFLIHLGPPPKTAEGQKLVAEFEVHLKGVFKPRNCAMLGQHEG